MEMLREARKSTLKHYASKWNRFMPSCWKELTLKLMKDTTIIGYLMHLLDEKRA